MKKILILSLITFALGQNNVSERIEFMSANPFSFQQIILDLDNQTPQVVFGELTFPTDFDSSKKYPLIIGNAGSLNWAEHHLKYLEMYRQLGFATFQLRSFDARGVDSTVGDQVDVTVAMVILDSYRALELLSRHPNIDAENVGITGWSLGGGVALYSAWMPLVKAINGGAYQFAAHLPIYPPCFVYPVTEESMEFTAAPIHILAGGADNWVPAVACSELIDQLKANNIPVDIDITIYENAHHSFDKTNVPLTVRENGYTLGDCRFPMNEDGTIYYSENIKLSINQPWKQKLALATCAGRGPTMGTNEEARQQAFAYSAWFFTKHLMENNQ